jgi:hypothetical protein
MGRGALKIVQFSLYMGKGALTFKNGQNIKVKDIVSTFLWWVFYSKMT